MRIAFVIAKLFPSGGLQRDCIAMANLLVQRGHDVTVFAAARRGEFTLAAPVEVLPQYGLNNAMRVQGLMRGVRRRLDRFDRVVGFEKLPDLDVYYCADPPYADVPQPWWRRIGLKQHIQRQLEASCFAPESKTSVIVLHGRQQASYRRVWGTPDHRFRIIPPTLDPARLAPNRRADVRAALPDGHDGIVWLAVASAPKVKGIDRTIAALAKVADARLRIVGLAEDSPGGRWVRKQAQAAGVTDRVTMLGHREDIVDVMAAADLLVHPARLENTGTAIMEAVANGLPVIVSDACGFAENVRAAEAGLVVPEPFTAEALLHAIQAAGDPALRARWSANGMAYGRRENLASGHAVAAELASGPLWACA